MDDEWRRWIEDRMTKVEGRSDRTEGKVATLDRFRSYLLGAASVVGFGIGTFWTWVTHGGRAP